MVVSAQSVDDMSKQKATGEHHAVLLWCFARIAGVWSRYFVSSLCTVQTRHAVLHFRDFSGAELVWQAIQGQWMSSCLGVLLELKVPEVLGKADKPLALEEVSNSSPIYTSTFCCSNKTDCLQSWSDTDSAFGRVSNKRFAVACRKGWGD